MTILEIKKLLAEEMEYKKTYVATWDTACSAGNHHIIKGNEYIYLGDKKKVCIDCLAEIIEFLEE